jgi:hypothetical protein
LSRPPLVATGLTFALLVAAAPLLLRGRLEAPSSSLSRGALGWLAARRYLEARGREVSTLAHPRSVEPGVRVVGFPWQRGEGVSDHELVDHLRRGHTLLLGVGDMRSGAQEEILHQLELRWQELAGDPPLHPLRWRAAVAAESWLHPQPGPAAGASPARIRAPRRAPAAPDSARVLYRDPLGVPMVFSFARLGGRVVVFPAEALANARLGERGNADLLEALMLECPGPWQFDEFHHGLVALDGATPHPPRVLDLALLHLAVAYALALVALARRFGPGWDDPPPISGTTRSFLLGLATMHHQLGHHAAAARSLIERARRFDPGLRVPEELVWRAHRADAGSFLEVARDVSRVQSNRWRS